MFCGICGKRIVVAILSIAITILIVGCSNSQTTSAPNAANDQISQSTEQAPAPVQEQSPTELRLLDDASASEETAKGAVYAPILSLYKTALEEHWTRDVLEANGVNYLCMYASDASTWGYDILDIDHNGTEELLIGETGEYGGLSGEFHVLYTLANDTPKLLISGGERDCWYLCEDGYLKNESSGSAFNHEISYYGIDIYGERTLFEAVIYDADLDANNPLYCIGNQAPSEYSPITDSMAEQIQNRHKNAAIYFTSFADYSEEGQAANHPSNTVAQKELDKYKYLSTVRLESDDIWPMPAGSPEEAENMLEDFYGTWYDSETGEQLSFDKYHIGGRSYYVHRAENWPDCELYVTISYSDKPEPDVTLYNYPMSADEYTCVFCLVIESSSGTKEYYSIPPYEYRAMMESSEPYYPQNVQRISSDTVISETFAAFKNRMSEKYPSIVNGKIPVFEYSNANVIYDSSDGTYLCTMYGSARPDILDIWNETQYFVRAIFIEQDGRLIMIDFNVS